MSIDIKSLLIDGIRALNLEVDEDCIANLLEYVQLLLKWNKTFSLTTIIELDEVIQYHILDGLTLVKYLEENLIIRGDSSIIDVGSGMGVPGIILAIYFKQNMIEVLDSNSKKTSFLKQVAIELGLQNLIVTNSRIEEYNPTDKYDIITSRAFAETKLFVDLSKHLLKQNGCFIAMKSDRVIDELNGLDDYSVDMVEVTIPKVAVKRFLVKIQ